MLSAPRLVRKDVDAPSPKVGGVYVVRSQSTPGCVRVGAGGNSPGSTNSVWQRVRKHSKEVLPERQEVETHRLAPYDAALVWELPGWPWTSIAMAEAALYKTVEELKLERHSGELSDKSNYAVPADFDMETIVVTLAPKLEMLRSI